MLSQFAVTIGSYEMPEMVELNIAQLRHVFGADVPILVSDDLSRRSVEIRDVCHRCKVHHFVSETSRGHFAGDSQACVNALAFARWESAQLAVKISQRVMLVEPVVRDILQGYFANPEVWLALPGRIHPGSIRRMESRFFANLPLLTDVLCIRAGAITPERVKQLYEARVRSPVSRHDTLVESLWGFLVDTHFAHHTVFLRELSHHFPGRDRLFLRKCQSEPYEYQRLAAARGLTFRDGWVPLLQEWKQLSASYRPIPQFI